MNTVTVQFRTTTFALLIAALVTFFIMDRRNRDKVLRSLPKPPTTQAFAPAPPKAPMAEPIKAGVPPVPTPGRKPVVIIRPGKTPKQNAAPTGEAQQIIDRIHQSGREYLSRRMAETAATK
jgi:hypothetical protein